MLQDFRVILPGDGEPVRAGLAESHPVSPPRPDKHGLGGDAPVFRKQLHGKIIAAQGA